MLSDYVKPADESRGGGTKHPTDRVSGTHNADPFHKPEKLVMPCVYIAGNEKLEPWRGVFRKLRDMRNGIKSAAKDGKPRIEQQRRELYADACDLVRPLLEKQWLDSFPDGTEVYGFDITTVSKLLDLVCLRHTPGSLTWDMLRQDIIDVFAEDKWLIPGYPPSWELKDKPTE